MRWITSLLVCVVIASPALAQGKDKKDKKKDKTEPGLEGLKALRHEDPEVRYKAAAVLVRLGPVAKFASTELREVFREEKNLEVKVKMAEAVWAVDRPLPSVLVPFLIEALKAKDVEVRAAAAGVLGQMGPKAKAALKPLIEGLKDKETIGRIAVIVALGEIGPVAKDAAEPILGVIDEKNEDLLIDTVVTSALGKLGAGIVPLLDKTLADELQRRRLAAAYALGEIGAPAKEAVPNLEKLLREKGELPKLIALQALGKIGKGAKDSVDVIELLLKSKSNPVRLEAAIALRLIAGHTKQLPLVLEYLADDKHDLVHEACVALKHFGKEAKDAVPELQKLTKHRDFGLRMAAALSLWAVTGKAEETLKVYEATIDNSDNAIRRRTLEHLEEMGPAAAPLLPLIQEAARDEDDAVRFQARSVLAKLAEKK